MCHCGAKGSGCARGCSGTHTFSNTRYGINSYADSLLAAAQCELYQKAKAAAAFGNAQLYAPTPPSSDCVVEIRMMFERSQRCSCAAGDAALPEEACAMNKYKYVEYAAAAAPAFVR